MKIVLQDGTKDCGICCLLSIIRFYGGEVSKEFLRDLTNTTKSGVSAYNIVKAAEYFGFNAVGVTGKIKNIEKNNLPCIAHVIVNKTYQHFIVIYDINHNTDKVLIMDPAYGKKKIKLSEFNLMTSGNYILLNPKKKIPVMKKNKIILKTIKKLLISNKLIFIFILFLTLNNFILSFFSAFSFKYFIDNVIDYNTTNNIKTILCLLLCILFLKSINEFIRNYILVKTNSIFDKILTEKTINQIISLPYLYYSNRTTGEVISRIKDLSIIKTYLTKLLISISSDIPCIIVFTFVLLKLSKNLTIVVSIFLIIVLILNIVFKNIIKEKIKIYKHCEEKTNSMLIETLSSNDTIKNIHIENKMISRFTNYYDKLLQSYNNYTFIEEIKDYLKNNINSFSNLSILFYGTILVVNEKLSLSKLIIYQSILNYHVTSFNNIISLFEDYPNYILSKERIEELYTIRKEKFIGYEYYNDIKLLGTIEYKKLSYSYNSKKLLSNITLKIKSKEKIFITGPNGCGKSTLIKILMRYIDIDYGYVKINKIDINHYHLDTIRKRITYVSQQSYLYTASLIDNIKLFRKIDNEKINMICKNLYIDDLITDEKIGYNMLVEENGFNFSGGERQRIVMARSILKESDIYIFDESLSQVDVEREREILKFLLKCLKDKTIIYISHRFNNKDLFKRIIQIKDGTIHETNK